MARAKSICKGKNLNGTQCMNWALKGSSYCHNHQNQFTKEDQRIKDDASFYSSLIIIGIVVIGFLIATAGGCQSEFLDWLSR